MVVSFQKAAMVGAGRAIPNRSGASRMSGSYPYHLAGSCTDTCGGHRREMVGELSMRENLCVLSALLLRLGY